MKTDVLVIGGGITARRAASVISKKYSVTLLQDGAGASPFIHGLNVPLDSSDSAELFLSDTLESGKGQCDPELAKALCDGSLLIKEELSCRFDRRDDGSYDLLKPLGSTLPRVAGIGGKTGAVILSELKKSKEYTELSDTRALSLIKDGERVVGARAFDKKRRVHFEIHARAVLVATGGFGGIFRFSTNSPDIGGDGAAMLCEAGCPLVDMEFIQYEPTVAIDPPALVGKSIITTMLFEGAVMRNKNGERFMDEKVGKDALSRGISLEIARGNGTPDGGVFYDMTAVPENMLLGKYKDYYARYKNAGIDISKTPVKIAPAPHTTMGGALINKDTSTPIGGLFVAGEAAGGIHGANRLGGNAGLEVFVFGDIAGRAITAYLDGNLDTGAVLGGISEEIADESFDGAELRERLHKVCDRALGVVKNETDLLAAKSEVDRIIELTAKKERSFDARRLFNDATALKLVITAALMRKESVGGHVRADGEDAPMKKYRIIIENKNGKITARKQDL